MAVQIGKKKIDHGGETFIIGEIGINHNGSLEIAKKLIKEAHDAGFDAVKFQTRTIPRVYAPNDLLTRRLAHRQLVESAIQRGVYLWDDVTVLGPEEFQITTLHQKMGLEFTESEYREIDAYARNLGIVWFSSPWDRESVDRLDALGVPCFKVASACLTYDNLLRHIRSKGKPVLLSTGMSTMEEIIHAVEILGTEDLIILHSVSTYPAEDKDLNLRAVRTLQKQFPTVPVGYSGHERGIDASVAAVTLGASVIERHITLGRDMPGSDQAASLEPQGMHLLVRNIRKLPTILGDGNKVVISAEEAVKKKLRNINEEY